MRQVKRGMVCGLVVLFGLGGCGEQSEDASNYCEGLEEDAPSSDIEASPRARPDLETLAIAMDDSTVADQTTYEQIEQDVEAIQAAFPKVEDVTIYPSSGSTVLMLQVSSEDVATQMSDGTYEEWDCLDEHFGPAQVSVLGGGGLVILPHVLEPSRVAERYAGLPDVTQAGPNPTGGDGPTICANWQNDERLYLFDNASGDCPSGCTESELSLFSVDADGNVAEEALDSGVTSVEDVSGYTCP